jgi:polyribonucleotide nucleotidyltransferase
MFNIITQELEFAGKKLVLEYGKLARQADSAVMVSYGKTKILCTVVYQKGTEVVNDFFPLTVAYMERYHAVGKIPGGFVKRETKPNEGEILISRLIDRTIRPLFDEHFLNEVQVACTVFSYEADTTPEFIALIGAVATLRTTQIPFYETVAGVKLGYVNGEFVANPSASFMRKSKLDMFVSSTKKSVLMVESEAHELTEDEMMKAVEFAMEQNAKLIDFIDEFAGKVNGFKGINPLELPVHETTEIEEKMSSHFAERVSNAFELMAKRERREELDVIKAEVKAMFLNENSEPKEVKKIEKLFKELEKKVVRKKIVFENKRIDGRTKTDIRPIMAEVSPLPIAHGSALFTRGETQALVSITLGNEKDEQMVDTMASGLEYDRFTLHYNFPGFSVGEVARFGAPGRREIGHGNLAKKALRPMLPSKEEYPFAIRAVSDILESNGSSSMATVCGVSLGLLSAGVPMKKLVSGIAMGLVKEEENFTVLSDILGDEDALGDMDFKVAGTEDGITALQMDIKIRGITPEILREAIEQAKAGRAHIMAKMKEGISIAPKPEPKATPKMKVITVPEASIKLIIGQGGSVIKDLCARTGANIDIAKQGGVVKVSALDDESVELAVKLIDSIVNPPKEERPPLDEGMIYAGIVKKILDGYLLVRLDNGANGYVYGYDISYSRFERIEDVFRVGEKVKAKVLSAKEDSEVKLSLKFVDQETGKDISKLYAKENNNA